MIPMARVRPTDRALPTTLLTDTSRPTPDTAAEPGQMVKISSNQMAAKFTRSMGLQEDDAAAVTGPGRHYLLAALTHHPRGDGYLEKPAAAVDRYLAPTGN